MSENNEDYNTDHIEQNRIFNLLFNYIAHQAHLRAIKLKSKTNKEEIFYGL